MVIFIHYKYIKFKGLCQEFNKDIYKIIVDKLTQKR